MQHRSDAAALAVLAFVALGAGAPARADIAVRARIDNFGYRLVDLRPGDGIAPALRFLEPKALQIGAAVYQQDEANPVGDFETLARSGDDFNLALNAALPGVGRSWARMQGVVGPAPGDFDLAVRGTLRSRAGDEVERGVDAYAEPLVAGYGKYEVTPYTRVVFTAYTAVEVRRTVANTASFLQLASARIRVEFSPEPNNRQTQELLVELAREPDMHQSLAGRQRFVFQNTTGEAGEGYINVLTGVRGQVFRLPHAGAAMAPAAPVPEPAAVAMALCGLGVVAGVARRGRRRAAAAAATGRAPGRTPVSG